MKEKTKKPSKQRKELFQAPHHKRNKIISAHLSSELRSSYNTRSIPVRTGDTVKVLRGDREGYEGKIAKVDRKNYRVTIEGVNREKADGTTVPIPIHPSKIEVVRLNLDDKWRKEILERKGPVEEGKMPEEKTTEKSEIEQPEALSEKVSVEAGGS